ncbi:MAG: IS3 family transposase [Burkholderiales bacterium]
MVSPSAKRRAVQHVCGENLGSTVQACAALGLARSTFYRASRVSRSRHQIEQRVMKLSEQHPRYGYRRITELLRREGLEVNPKRVQRVRRVAGLQVRRQQRRTRRLGSTTVERQRATHRNHVWTWDFLEDQTERGQRFRMLTLLDEHTRECLAIHVAWSIRAVDVIGVVGRAIGQQGAPAHIRSDNGSEFIAYALRDWLEAQAVKTLYIRPGSPWENGYIESFHDKLRDECLNRELFGNLEEARVVIEQWRSEYNERRPHSSLGYQTPREFARQLALGLRSATPPPAPGPININRMAESP